VTWAIFASCGDCFFCANGLPQKCVSLFKYGHARLSAEQPLSGGLASHILLRRGTTIVPIPDSLPDEIAVLANCSTATAFASIRCAELRPGSAVAILGLGILGLTAAAILSSQGHTVVAFDPDAGKGDLALGFGCGESFTDIELFRRAIHALTDERGADACLELSGARSAAELSLDCVRIGGTVIWTGAAAPIGEIAIKPERVLRRQLTIKGVHNYVPTDLENAVDFLHQNFGDLPFASLIGSQFALNEVGRAFEEASAARSRILVGPG
jgi:alcohol dehydrogenase